MTRGLGLHIDRVMASDPRPPSAFITLWKVGWVNSISIYLCLFCTKMSLLWLYRRLFWIARWFRLGWYLNLTYATALTICAFLTAVFQCTPVSFAWNRMYPLTHTPAPFPVSGHCIHSRYATYLAAFSLGSDVGIWLLPVIAVLKLQMTAKRKIELCLLLSLGVMYVGGVRAPSSSANSAPVPVHADLLKRSYPIKPLRPRTCHVRTRCRDKTPRQREELIRPRKGANAPLAIWAAAEQGTGILCSCIPVIVGSVKSMRAKSHPKSNAYRAGYDNRQHPAGLRDKSVAKSAERELANEDGSGSVPKARSMGFHRNTSDDIEMQPARQHAEWM